MALPLLAAGVVAAAALLGGDVRYALGGIRTGQAGGFPLEEVFIARPYGYALAMQGLDWGREVVTADATSALAETTIRVVATVVVCLIGLLLYAGLMRHLTRAAAGAIAVAVSAAMAITPVWTFLQPDWLGAVCAVLALAAALALRPAVLAVGLGGFAIALTVAIKLATAPWAVAALVVIALLSWRRAVGTAVAGVAFSLLWAVFTRTQQPQAWMWLQDQVALVHDSPLNHPPRWDDYISLLSSALSAAVVNPIIIIAPAAALVLVLRRPAGAPRIWAAVAAVALLALSVGSPFGQGEWFMYHYAGTPIMAAGVVAAAWALSPGSRPALLGGAVVATAAAATLLAQPEQWRVEWLWLTSVVVVGIGVGTVVLVLVGGRQRRGAGLAPRTGRWSALLGSAALALTLAAPSAPTAAFAYTGVDAQYRVSGAPESFARFRGLSAQVREAVGGSEVPVLYLSYGIASYFIDNPSVCRYPSPQWVQRSTAPVNMRLPSYRDNLRCLEQPGPAKFAIVQPSWFRLGALPDEVSTALERNFDCARSDAVRRSLPPAERRRFHDLILCPRRT